MGFRLRKSINLGGARINLSKSGVGYSVGAKGMRITKCANGRTRKTVSIPGTGISYVSESGKAKRKVERKEKQIKTSGIIAVSANKAIIRDYTFDIEKEVSKTVIVFMSCIVRFCAWFNIACGLLFMLISAIPGLFFIAIGVLALYGSRQYKQALKDMKDFEKEKK